VDIGYPPPHEEKRDCYKPARILVTSIFFMWGLSYGLLEVLNKHFQEMLDISKAQSGLLQTAYFGAYFLAAFPAATFMRRRGYKNGLLLGLSLYALGALLFALFSIPASLYGQFWPFLGALFVLACGLACLETAANPLMVQLGEQKNAARRLNLAQAFCGLGCFVGPLLGGIFLFNDISIPAVTPTSTPGRVLMESVRIIYSGLAVTVILIAIYIKNSTPLDAHSNLDHCRAPGSALLTSRQFIFGVVALFFYVAAQVGVGALFINYVTEYGENLTSKGGAFLLSVSLFIFMSGRFVSTWLMGYVKPNALLGCYSFACLVLCAIVMMGLGSVSVIALTSIFFCMSIMFPTIFSIAIDNLGTRAKRGSSILMMTMIGGAISPFLMGYIADNTAIKFAYAVPFFCFIAIFLYSRFVSDKATISL